jgi:hypothetical protein
MARSRPVASSSIEVDGSDLTRRLESRSRVSRETDPLGARRDRTRVINIVTPAAITMIVMTPMSSAIAAPLVGPPSGRITSHESLPGEIRASCARAGDAARPRLHRIAIEIYVPPVLMELVQIPRRILRELITFATAMHDLNRAIRR